MRRLRRGALVALVVATAACSGGGSARPAVRLDGSPRIPDLEGVARHVTLSQIEIAGRRLRISRTLQSFSTYDGSPAALLNREGQYVQAGVKGDVLQWLAGIGVVVSPPGVVYYVGNLVGLQKGRLVFRDGTTLGVAKGVDVSARGQVRAQIDPVRHVVTVITPV